MTRQLAVALAGVAVLFTTGSGHAKTQAPSGFAARIAALSEPGGFFDTDNLISNERGYLRVLPALTAARVSGGAYIGVGPDQNFSYIAHIRPDIAFIVDLRRDNLLLHLLLKALFTAANTRVEYVSLLFGRSPPTHPAEWRDASAERLLDHAQGSSAHPPSSDDRARIEGIIRSFGVPLSDADLETIRRFHRTFAERGPSLKFTTFGRAPRDIYPTYRDLLVARSSEGDGSYLASEERFNVVRSLQQRDLIIPVVGDVAGDTAVPAVGRFMIERKSRLSAIYVSNVESYLSGDGRFATWIDNLASLPRTERSVVIRSVFGGSASSSLVQRVDELVKGYAAGRFRSYYELTR